MKRKILWAMMALMSLSVVAEEATHLRVHRTDGTVLNAALDEQLVLDFLQDNISEYMELQQSNVVDMQIALLEIHKMTFGDSIIIEPDTDSNSDTTTKERNTMYVHYVDGTIFSTSLDEQIVLSFLKNNIQISLLERAPLVVEITNVQKITFTTDAINVPNFIEDGFAYGFHVYVADNTIFAQSTAAMQQICIWNLQGQMVLNQRIENLQHAEISAAHLTKGIYVIQITTTEKTETQKVVIK